MLHDYEIMNTAVVIVCMVASYVQQVTGLFSPTKRHMRCMRNAALTDTFLQDANLLERNEAPLGKMGDTIIGSKLRISV
jgi:hypothetical protein